MEKDTGRSNSRACWRRRESLCGWVSGGSFARKNNNLEAFDGSLCISMRILLRVFSFVSVIRATDWKLRAVSVVYGLREKIRGVGIKR